MTAVPAIYGNLSEAAKAAYACWMDALLTHGEHTLDCQNGCGLSRDMCPIGIALRAEEQSEWRLWDAARRLERGNA